MSVRLSGRTGNKSAPAKKDFHENLIFDFQKKKKSVEKIHVSLKSEKN
jgi:hypothetical protein